MFALFRRNKTKRKEEVRMYPAEEYSRTILRNTELHWPNIQKGMADDLSIEQIAIMCGTAPACIRRYIRVKGVDYKRNKRATKKTLSIANKALEMRKEGQTLQQIGDHFGVSRERIRQILSRTFPDIAIGNSVHGPVKDHHCLECGTVIKNSKKKWCSSSCRKAYKQKEKQVELFDRNNAVEIMALRDKGYSWKKVFDELKPPMANPNSFRSTLSNRMEYFSTEEREKYFPKRGK